MYVVERALKSDRPGKERNRKRVIYSVQFTQNQVVLRDPCAHERGLWIYPDEREEKARHHILRDAFNSKLRIPRTFFKIIARNVSATEVLMNGAEQVHV